MLLCGVLLHTMTLNIASAEELVDVTIVFCFIQGTRLNIASADKLVDVTLCAIRFSSAKQQPCG